MAKVQGFLLDSKSHGRLIGLGFCFFANPYGAGYGNMNVRRFQTLRTPPPKHFYDKNLQFAQTPGDWNDASEAQQQEYTDYAEGNPKSGFELFMEDHVWLPGSNPFDQPQPTGAPPGYLHLVEYDNMIRVLWRIDDPDWEKPSDLNQIVVYKGVNETPTKDYAHRLNHRMFEPTQKDWGFELRIHDDYDIDAGNVYHYQFECCSARVYCGDMSPEYKIKYLFP